MPRILGGRRINVLRKLLVIAFAQVCITFVLAFVLHHVVANLKSGELDPWWFVGLALCGLTSLGFKAVEAHQAEYLGQSYVLAVRARMLKHIVMQSTRTRPASWGLTMVRMISDLNSLKNWVAVGLARGSAALVLLLGICAALTFLAPISGLICIIWLALCVSISLLGIPHLRQSVFNVRRWRGRLAARVGEQVTARRAIRQFGELSGEAKKLQRLSKRLRRLSAKRMMLAHTLRTLPQATLPIALGASLAFPDLPIETFAVVVLLQSLAANALREVIRAWDYRISFDIAEKRIGKIFQAPRTKEPRSPEILNTRNPAFELKNVVLANSCIAISGKVQQGTITRITRTSSIVPPQLFDLLTRIQEPIRGTVEIAGTPLSHVSVNNLARHVQLVSPNIPLFRGSVETNLLYGDAPTSIDLTQLCHAGNLSEADRATAVQELGTNLPTVLRSRITLLRAARFSPALLLVDDDSLIADPDGLESLHQVIRQLGCTAVIATNNEIEWIDADLELSVSTPSTNNVVHMQEGAHQ